VPWCRLSSTQTLRARSQPWRSSLLSRTTTPPASTRSPACNCRLEPIGGDARTRLELKLSTNWPLRPPPTSDRLPHKLVTTMARIPQPSPPHPVTALWATLTAFTCGRPSSLLSLAYLCLLFSLRGGRRCVQCVGAVRGLIFMVIIGRRAPPVLEAGARDFTMMLLTIWQGSSSVPVFLAPAKKQTYLSTTVYVLMVCSMSAGISTFLVLMAVFLGVGQSSMLCARLHTTRKEKCVLLQTRVDHDGPPQWVKPSKSSMPSTMALTLAWVTPCAFGTGTHGGLEPDACRLLRHLSYARGSINRTKCTKCTGLLG
jgi:hypothetical protein